MDRAPPILLFFLLSHGITWVCWIPAAFLAAGPIWESSARWLVYLGGLGPPVAGIALIRHAGGRGALIDLASRILDPRRIPPRWLLVLLLVPPLSMGVAVASAAIAGDIGSSIDFSRLSELALSPLQLTSFAAFVLFFGPLPEEIGWRGYALDALQLHFGALAASLLLGAAWALWHLPLFLIPGYYAPGDPPDPLLFTTAIVAHSILYTWIYNHTDRSVLAAILFHFMINFVGMLIEGDDQVEWVRTAAVAVLAAVALWRSGTSLGRDAGRQAGS